MAVILRSNLGRKMTFSEMDENFEYLSSNPKILNNKRIWVWLTSSSSYYIQVVLDKSDKSTLFGINGEFGRLVEFPTLIGCPALRHLKLFDNSFPEDVVNQILVDMDANGGSGGIIELNNPSNTPANVMSASPSGDGLTARDSLLVKGWAISTN